MNLQQVIEWSKMFHTEQNLNLQPNSVEFNRESNGIEHLNKTGLLTKN